MYQNNSFPPPPPPPYGGICAVNPVVETIKRLGRSPMFLWVCILQTAAAGLTLLQSILSMLGLTMIVDTMEMYEDFPGEFLESTGAGLSLSFVFPALFALGLWLVRAACRSDASPFVTTGGLKTVKVLITINLVMMYILAGCMPLLLLAVIALMGSGEDFFSMIGEFDEEFIDDFSASSSLFEGVFTGVLLVALVVVLAVAVVGIIYYHILRKGIATLEENCEGILSDRSFPMFVIVMFYVFAGGSFFSALTGLVLTPVAALAEGVSGSVYLMGAILMQKYRKGMEHLRMVSMGAPVPPADFQPAPAPGPMPEPNPGWAVPPVPGPVSQPAPPPMPGTAPQPETPKEVEGEPQPKTVGYCPSCGRAVKEGESFCAGCGRSVDGLW